MEWELYIVYSSYYILIKTKYYSILKKVLRSSNTKATNYLELQCCLLHHLAMATPKT